MAQHVYVIDTADQQFLSGVRMSIGPKAGTKISLSFAKREACLCWSNKKTAERLVTYLRGHHENAIRWRVRGEWVT